MKRTEEQEEREIKHLSSAIPTFDINTFIPSVKKGDHYKFNDGTETVAQCDSYLNCDNMECCIWNGFGCWMVCRMTKA